MKNAIDHFLAVKRSDKSPYELMKDLIGPQTDESPSRDVARHTKQLLRQRVRGKRAKGERNATPRR
jgi:hypothetical protein